MRTPGRIVLFYVLVLLTAIGGFSNLAQAKPRRHPGELDLILRAEWDGDMNGYLKELRAQKKLENEARAEQRKLRQQEELTDQKNRELFRRERIQQDRAARMAAGRAAYADYLQYKKEQNIIRHDYAVQRAAERSRKKQTRVARLTNFKAIRLAVIRYHRDTKTRSPAMIKMPKPDTAELKGGLEAPDPMAGNAYAPPLPAPPMDASMYPPPMPLPPPNDGNPMPGMDQNPTASAAPTFAPNGADSSRAFGGSAR